MKYKNKFQDGESVQVRGTRELVTINKWSYIPSMKRYTYTLIEHPETFVFEDELMPVEGEQE
ncbi:hypothetical protein ACFSR7_35955 [Cohnella sp. GCM10020058]|uniref:hypothetical protein n=1 Tax=Cohnella sp. GCM10020058 TaxID=3317330 RepID=UPI00362F67B9